MWPGFENMWTGIAHIVGPIWGWSDPVWGGVANFGLGSMGCDRPDVGWFPQPRQDPNPSRLKPNRLGGTLGWLGCWVGGWVGGGRGEGGWVRGSGCGGGVRGWDAGRRAGGPPSCPYPPPTFTRVLRHERLDLRLPSLHLLLEGGLVRGLGRLVELLPLLCARTSAMQRGACEEKPWSPRGQRALGAETRGLRWPTLAVATCMDCDDSLECSDPVGPGDAHGLRRHHGLRRPPLARPTPVDSGDPGAAHGLRSPGPRAVRRPHAFRRLHGIRQTPETPRPHGFRRRRWSGDSMGSGDSTPGLPNWGAHVARASGATSAP